MKSLHKFVLAIGVVVFVPLAVGYLQARPIRNFCEKLPGSATPEQVKALAEESGLIFLGRLGEPGPVSVINHRIYFWRYACQIEFSGGMVSSRRFMAAD